MTWEKSHPQSAPTYASGKNCHASSSNRSWQMIRSCWWSVIIDTVIPRPSLQRFPEEVNLRLLLSKFMLGVVSPHSFWCHGNNYWMHVYFICCMFLCFSSVSWDLWRKCRILLRSLPCFVDVTSHWNNWSLKSWNNGGGTRRHRNKRLSLCLCDVRAE